jgi:hypothetical protein
LQETAIAVYEPLLIPKPKALHLSSESDIGADAGC